MLDGEALEEVDQFKYLGSIIAANGVKACVVCLGSTGLGMRK